MGASKELGGLQLPICSWHRAGSAARRAGARRRALGAQMTPGAEGMDAAVLVGSMPLSAAASQAGRHFPPPGPLLRDNELPKGVRLTATTVMAGAAQGCTARPPI